MLSRNRSAITLMRPSIQFKAQTPGLLMTAAPGANGAIAIYNSGHTAVDVMIGPDGFYFQYFQYPTG